MPIMASQGRSDARGTAQLLASMALDCISNPNAAPDQQVALNNVYRLLESFRTRALFDLDAPIRHPAEGALERLTLHRPLERHLKEVGDALDQALRLAFVDTPTDNAVRTIEDVLRALAYPDRRVELSDEDQRKASRFFEEFIRHLE